MSDNRPSVYFEDDLMVIRGSALGGCINELALIARGEQRPDFDPYIREVLDFGTNAEDAIAEAAVFALGGEDYEWLDSFVAQETIELKVGKNAIVRGHTDGRVRLDREYGMEFKTAGLDGFKALTKGGKILPNLVKGFPEYTYQLSAYMHAVGLPFVYAVALRENSGTYEEPEFSLGQVVAEVIEEPPLSLAKIRRKAQRIKVLMHTEIEELPVCEKSKFCSMQRFHDIIGGNVEKEEASQLDEEDDNELLGKLVRRQEIMDQIKALEAERKTIDAELKEVLEGPVSIPGVGKWTPISKSGRVSIDRDQMILDLGAEVVAKYEKVGKGWTEIRFTKAKGA